MKLRTTFETFAFVCLTLTAQASAEDLLTIDNGIAKVGIDRHKGAAITWLSSKPYPGNMINLADPGRLIQQSYYAGKSLDRTAEGQSKSWSPWTWNPIQGGGVGSWARASKTERNGDTLYSETTPKLWDMPNEEARAFMRQWTTFEPSMPNTIVVKCEFVSLRDKNDPWGEANLRPQEVPACYFTRNFASVKSYLGNGEWRKEVQPPGPPWPGLAAGGMSNAASDYFDFYLDGKPPTRTRVKPSGDNPTPDKKQQSSTSAAGITPWQLRNGEFTQTDEGLLISANSKGRQSAFLTRNGIRLTGPVAVELTVRTEAEGPITISWRTKETPEFNSANRAEIGVEQAGKWQDLKATIADSSEIIHVRVQFPGRKVMVRNLQLRPSAGNPVTLGN